MRSFHTTYSAAHMYGPGDEETWGLYAGHTMDPRRPAEDDDIVREEARNELIAQRIRSDIVWLTEAVEEADDKVLLSIVDGYMNDDWKRVKASLETILDYASPTEEEITAHIRSRNEI